MSGLSHTPGKRAWGKTHRGFESRLLRQNEKPAVRKNCGLFHGAYFWTLCTIFMAEPINVETSVMLAGTISVVVASSATLL